MSAEEIREYAPVTMASDTDVPTWVNVRCCAALVVVVPEVVALLVVADSRLKVGAFKAGAAKSVTLLRLAAPTTQLA